MNVQFHAFDCLSKTLRKQRKIHVNTGRQSHDNKSNDSRRVHEVRVRRVTKHSIKPERAPTPEPVDVIDARAAILTGSTYAVVVFD